MCGWSNHECHFVVHIDWKNLKNWNILKKIKTFWNKNTANFKIYHIVLPNFVKSLMFTSLFQELFGNTKNTPLSSWFRRCKILSPMYIKKRNSLAWYINILYTFMKISSFLKMCSFYYKKMQNSKYIMFWFFDSFKILSVLLYFFK